ncbi:hypothetical protein AC579_8095 [Pseudocercospora musae]|uniref:Uncharacterized protein n=1 Tax=Pseudocercospora musae TaxID=113226 RepID=A0A139IFR3_9PEZI|nr:hypothetical protein AC579_8095 [Pseudocercospora musae]
MANLPPSNPSSYRSKYEHNRPPRPPKAQAFNSRTSLSIPRHPTNVPMSFAPYQWRHDQGYLPPPGSVPIPIIPATMSAPHSIHQIAYQAAPPPPPAAYCFPPGQPVLAAAPPPKPCSSAPTHCSTKPSDPKPPPSDYAPPSLRPGINYLFPSSHTILHIFSKAAPIWHERFHGQNLNFKIFRVATCFTPRNIIERIVTKNKGEGECKGWAVTEVVEAGDGVWRKGTTVLYDGEGKGDLKALGWNEKRGKELPPVWLVVHKKV